MITHSSKQKRKPGLDGISTIHTDSLANHHINPGARKCETVEIKTVTNNLDMKPNVKSNLDSGTETILEYW